MHNNNQTDRATTYEDLRFLDELAGVYGLDPVSLRRIFLLLTRNHFSDPAYFGNLPETFRRFRYNDNPRDASVRIELDYSFDPARREQPTGIYVGVGTVKSQSRVIDDFTRGNEDLSGSFRHQLDQMPVVVSHVSASPDEALTMGVLSKAFFQGMGPLLRARFRQIVGYRVISLTEPQRVTPDEQSSAPYYRVDLTIELTLPSEWETTMESLRIKRINLDTE
jgi:hypothetical protein